MRTLRDRIRRDAPDTPPRKVLVRLPNWVGDVVMAVPAVDADHLVQRLLPVLLGVEDVAGECLLGEPAQQGYQPCVQRRDQGHRNLGGSGGDVGQQRALVGLLDEWTPVLAGSELNGTTTASDLGLGRMMSTKKDYIGRVMAGREAFQRPDRAQFVGLRPLDRSDRIRAGSHLLTRGSEPSMDNDQGYVTSVAFSPMLGQWIGLGLLKGGSARHGETVLVWNGLSNVHLLAEVVDPCFYDKEHKKLHG